ncbi:MAG: outer membrane protein assembly factor BamE [Hyphomicrobiaceae bacterium]|nr:outer membrane protein assembly factor BamE [Hyphomicrobiaceae bacterium]
MSANQKRATPRLATVFAAALFVTACAGQVDRHGHLFTDVDLEQIQPGMSQDQVRLTLGTPDTTGTLDGQVFYYISSTRKTLPAGRPKVIDRKVVAVYFDQNQTVKEVGRYGLKDGRIISFADGETPTYGKKLTALEQLFGNIANRRSLLKESAPSY